MAKFLMFDTATILCDDIKLLKVRNTNSYELVVVHKCGLETIITRGSWLQLKALHIAYSYLLTLDTDEDIIFLNDKDLKNIMDIKNAEFTKFKFLKDTLDEDANFEDNYMLNVQLNNCILQGIKDYMLNKRGKEN